MSISHTCKLNALIFVFTGLHIGSLFNSWRIKVQGSLRRVFCRSKSDMFV